MFKLGDRVFSVDNEFKDDPDYANGVVVVAVLDGDVVFDPELDRTDGDLEALMEFIFTGDEEEVIVKFDDGHLEWGYYGDDDFTLVE